MRLTVVDAFTDVPFRGNPAAVAVLDRFPTDRHLQEVAAELNLSETAFVVPRSDGDHDLRWFTPAVEVDLCGHATLAAAHVLGRPSARFHTRSGVLPCHVAADGRVTLNFPGDDPEPWAVAPDPGLAGVRWTGRGRSDVLIELGEAAAVRALVPDLQALARLGSRTVIVTAAGDRPGVDCVSRVFAPNVGVPEDPVTGSAHCTLAVYWGRRLGRSELVGVQASPRGGTVHMQLRGERVLLSGAAVTVATVEMLDGAVTPEAATAP